LHVSASKLIQYTKNITKGIEKPETDLIHTRIIFKDVGIVLHRRKSAVNSYALTLFRLGL
jgi:hypothetical protein